MIRKQVIRFIVLLTGLFFLLPPDAYAISWRYDLSGALKAAKKEQKPIMIDFYTDWCGWCKKLDRDTYSDSRVQKLAGQFICVKVDGDRNADSIGKYNIRGYPTILFLDSNGNIVQQIPGYVGPADFSKTMNAILEKTEKPVPVPKRTKEPKTEPPKKSLPEKIKEEIKEIIKKPSTAKPDTDFVYNGYIKGIDGEITAQVNYRGKTYFLKKGETFGEYNVLQIDTDKLILEGKEGRLQLEFKKPIKGR